MKHIPYFFFIVFMVAACNSKSPEENAKKHPSNKGEVVKIYISNPGESSMPHSKWEIGKDKPEGVETILIETIMKKLHLKFEYISNYESKENLDPRISVLTDNIADISIRGITITEKRKKEVLFSFPYFIDRLGILVHENSDLKDTSDLNGKTIFVIENTTSEEWAKKYLTNSEIISWREENERFSFPKDLVIKKTIDAFIIDESILKKIILDFPQLQLLDKTYSKESNGIAIRKDRKDLQKKINEVLIEMKESGELQEILDEMASY